MSLNDRRPVFQSETDPGHAASKAAIVIDPREMAFGIHKPLVRHLIVSFPQAVILRTPGKRAWITLGLNIFDCEDKYEHETFNWRTPLLLNFRVTDSNNFCGSGDSCHIAMHHDGHDGKSDEYFRQNLFVYRLGDDHRRLEFSLYAGYSKRNLQCYDKHTLRTALICQDFGAGGKNRLVRD